MCITHSFVRLWRVAKMSYPGCTGERIHAWRLWRMRRNNGSVVTDYAQQSIALCAGVAEPYWWWARALEKEGRIAEAASVLKESLPLTVFDAAHRKMLVRLWRSLGREREAQELAEKSFRIFKACWGREETAAAFCEMISQNAC